MKVKVLFFVMVVAIAVASFFQQYPKNGYDVDLLLENIEALGNAEHGEIDETLVPFRILDSKLVFVGYYPIRIPCCKCHSSPYTGCARGLDEC
jgi:hypothetical protein